MISGHKAIAFLTGLGVGVGLALLFAPQSGAETREWIEDTTEDGIKQLRKTGRKALRNLQAAVSKGEETMATAIKTGKDALETLSAKLD
ncbi:MAG: YtxH domain-containing protein [Candidatus Acidiferrum sp.]|jgi:gas vesicle protein